MKCIMTRWEHWDLIGLNKNRRVLEYWLVSPPVGGVARVNGVGEVDRVKGTTISPAQHTWKHSTVADEFGVENTVRLWCMGDSVTSQSEKTLLLEIFGPPLTWECSPLGFSCRCYTAHGGHWLRCERWDVQGRPWSPHRSITACRTSLDHNWGLRKEGNRA